MSRIYGINTEKSNTLVPLEEMFMHAVRWRYLRDNPAQYVEKPRVSHHEMDFFTPKESVYKGRFVKPKPTKSNRAINLPSILLEALYAHRVGQAEVILRAGQVYRNHDLIFCTTLGTPLDRRNVLKRDFWPLLKQAGLRRIRFHDLRHVFATLLITQEESPKYIQAQLGHASIQVTMDRYGHLLPDVHQQAAQRLKDSLFGPSVRNPLESSAFQPVNLFVTL